MTGPSSGVTSPQDGITTANDQQPPSTRWRIGGAVSFPLVAPAGDFFLTKAQDAAIGAMAAGANTALVIEVMPLPYTLILLASLRLGILGLAQFGVAAASASGVSAVARLARPFAGIGAEIFAAPSPIQSYEWSWIDGQLQALKSEDAAVVETALRALNDYPLNFRRFAIPACWYARDHAYPGLAHEVERVLGPNPADCETGDPHS